MDNPTSTPVPEEKTLLLSVPPVWLLRHYETFISKRLAFLNSLSDEQKKTISSAAADFMGGKGLIDVGYVGIVADSTTWKKFTDYLAAPYEDVPTSVVSLILLKIVRPLEASLNQPFLP